MSICRPIVDIIKSRLGDVLNLRNKTIQKEDGSYVSEGDLLVQSIVFDYVRTHMIEYELISEEKALTEMENIIISHKGVALGR